MNDRELLGLDLLGAISDDVPLLTASIANLLRLRAPRKRLRSGVGARAPLIHGRVHKRSRLTRVELGAVGCDRSWSLTHRQPRVGLIGPLGLASGWRRPFPELLFFFFLLSLRNLSRTLLRSRPALMRANTASGGLRAAMAMNPKVVSWVEIRASLTMSICCKRMKTLSFSCKNKLRYCNSGQNTKIYGKDNR